MKWNILYTENRPLRPCGIEVGAAMLGAAAISGIGSLVSASYSNSAASSMNYQNKEWEESEYDRRMEVNQKYQLGSESRQNIEFDRRLSEVMAEQSQEYDRRMNVYETPEAKVRLLQQAGFNPLSAVLQGGGSVSNPSSDVGTLPSGQVNVPSVQAPSSVTPTDIGVAAMTQSISQGIKAFADASKSGAETAEIQTLLSGKLQNLLVSTEGQNLLNESQRLDNFLKSETIDASVGKAFAEWRKECVASVLMQSESELADSQSMLAKAQEILAQHQSSLTAEQYEQAVIRTSQYAQELSAYRNNLNAMTRKAKSDAAFADANAALAKAKKVEQDLVNKLQSDPRYKHEQLTLMVENARQAAAQSKITQSQSKLIEYQIKQIEFATDHQEISFWVQQLSTVLGSLGDAATALYGAGAFKELSRLRSLQSQQLQQSLEPRRPIGFHQP